MFNTRIGIKSGCTNEKREGERAKYGSPKYQVVNEASFLSLYKAL